MRSLFLLIYRFRAFFAFLLLEVICAVLIVNNNPYHNVAALNSSSAIAGWTVNSISSTTEFLNQRERNEELSDKYARLENRLLQYQQMEKQYYIQNMDESKVNQFKFIPARVTKNSLRSRDNFITLDKGTEQGIEVGMAVVSTDGIVGRVKSCSDNFSLVTSFLHSKSTVSAMLEKTKTSCLVTWPGENTNEAEAKHLPRHITVSRGDSVVTSGFNAVYPEGFLIGTIITHSLNKKDRFHKATIKLATDFNSLYNVFVVKNELRAEQELLESQVDK